MANLIVQLEKAFNNITNKTCSGLVRKVRKIEDRFWNEDAFLDA